MKDIHFKNYQGIEKLDLELHPGVNVIIGPTDSCKSSVVRGVRDWAYNSIGHGHVTGGASKSTVEVDGLKWEKSKSVNRYSVGKKTYDKVGRGTVPDEIRERTGIREVEFGEGVSCRLHFAEQFDREFMVGFKASDNAKIVGSLSGIHSVFNALRDATADHNKARREVKDLERSVEDATETVRRHSWVEAVVKEIKATALKFRAVGEAEDLLGKWKTLRSRILQTRTALTTAEKETRSLEALAAVDIETCEEVQERLLVLKELSCKVLDARGIWEKALRAREALQVARDVDLSELEGYRSRVGSLRVLAIRISAARRQEKEASDACQRLQAVADVDFSALVGDRGRLEELRRLSGKLKATTEDISSRTHIFEESGDQLRIIRADYEEAVDGMDLCPVTGKAMPEDCKRELKGG